MKRILKKAAAFAFALILAASGVMLGGCGESDDTPGSFSKKTASGDVSFEYMLYTPEETKNMPVVVVFHGYGEYKDILNTRILTTLSGKERQDKNPCYILAPLVTDNIFLSASNREAMYSSIRGEIDKLVKKGKTDPERIYVIGNSFGGLATVEFAEKYPEDVAAIIPMCPALTYDDNVTKNIKQIKDVPAWFAHAVNDNVISVDTSRQTVSKLKAMGAEEVMLTEFSDEQMLSAGALIGFHQADFAVMADESFTDWLFDK